MYRCCARRANPRVHDRFRLILTIALCFASTGAIYGRNLTSLRIGGTSTLWGNSASTAGGEEACLSGTRAQAGAVLKMGAQYTDAFSMRPVDDQAYPFIPDSRILQGGVGPTTVSGGGTSYLRKATSATYPEGVSQAVV